MPLKLPISALRRGQRAGKTDFGLVADISRPIGKFSPFLTLGYRMPGDPAGFEPRDSATASAGATAAIGKLVADRFRPDDAARRHLNIAA